MISAVCVRWGEELKLRPLDEVILAVCSSNHCERNECVSGGESVEVTVSSDRVSILHEGLEVITCTSDCKHSPQ